MGSPVKARDAQKFVTVSGLLRGAGSAGCRDMRDVKDTLRALVRIGYDGRVFKTFRGPKADERFANEVRVLRHLEDRGCLFVPRLLEANPEELCIVTTNCGSRVEHLDDVRRDEILRSWKNTACATTTQKCETSHTASPMDGSV